MQLSNACKRSVSSCVKKQKEKTKKKIKKKEREKKVNKKKKETQRKRKIEESKRQTSRELATNVFLKISICLRGRGLVRRKRRVIFQRRR